ncbi:MAG: glycosyltransferase [Clostridia bacterium]|nr:glycosyltransferase [Clostridia bacterium]
MRVLQINATYGYGSTGLIMQDIGETLTAAGEEAFFAYQSAKELVPNGYCVGNRIDWKVHAVLCRLFGRQGYYSKAATRRFLRYLDEVKPDIVHLHNLHSNYIHLNDLLKYLAKKDIPTVITMHDCWYFTGKCFHYVDVGCDGFQHGCGNCLKKEAPPASLLFDCSRAVLRDRIRFLSVVPRLKIVGCSEWICGEAKKGFMRDFAITAIRNGVDITVFKPQDKRALKTARGLQDKFVVMGMANKWLLPSNRALLERTVAMLDDGAVLMLVGCTDGQKAQLARYGDKVVCIGFVSDRAQMAACYATADVFVNATHADTLPTVNMESICCGTPVITYDSCGSPELILEGCGYTVAEDDVDRMLERITAVRQSGAWDCSAIGAEHFDKNKSYRQYMDVYRELVKA